MTDSSQVDLDALSKDAIETSAMVPKPFVVVNHHMVMKAIAELRAAREVVEAARMVQDESGFNDAGGGEDYAPGPEAFPPSYSTLELALADYDRLTK